MNVVGIKGVTPEVLAQHVSYDAENIESIYVVAFSKTGEVWQYLSGDAKGMAFAGCILQEGALKASERVPILTPPSERGVER